MRALLKKLSVLLVIIIAWVVYDNWGRITSISLTSVKDAVVHSIPALPSDTKKSTVYQWKDEKGKVHVSNTPPENVKNVKILEYDNNLNVVVPSTPPPKKKRKQVKKLNSVSNSGPSGSSPSDGQGNIFDRYTTAIDDAKQVQELVDQRNKNLQERLQ